jgi:uncharacterized protein
MVNKICWLMLGLGLMLTSAAHSDEAPLNLADAAMARDMGTVAQLLASGADPNTTGQFQTPALHWVVRVEDIDTARLLLEAGADPDMVNAYELTPLSLALENADLAMVELLLSFGADPGRPNRTGETALFTAARHGPAAMLETLLNHGVDVNQREARYGQTPLMVAVRSGDPARVQVLLAQGADVNAQTLMGDTPAWRRPAENAGSKGVGIVRGGWPERGERAPVPGAKTPLLYATRAGNLAITRLLVEAGARLEQADGNAITPLLNAILNASVGRGEHLAVARYLVEQGANIHVVDWYGESPLWATVVVRNLDVVGPVTDNRMDRQQALALIELLLEKGADPDVRTREQPPERRFITRLGDLAWVDFTGQTPFLRAALAGDVTVMKLLLAHGADPNIPTYGGTTPLMAAAGVNWVVSQTFDEGPAALLEAVQLAHSLGNDVNAVNSMGLSAVHGAANRGSDDIIRYLAANGARLDGKDSQGRDPMQWAEGVFLATHPPVQRPATMSLLQNLMQP